MSNYQYTPPDQGFNADAFGQPMYEQPKRGGGARAFLFSCGGLTLIGVLICCCCVGASVWAARQPLVVAVVWGTGGASDWALSMEVVCAGSQAEQLTQDYIDAGATLQAFSSASDDLSAKTMNATGTIVVDGQEEPWAATITMADSADGGFFPTCIDQVDVTLGDISGTP